VVIDDSELRASILDHYALTEDTVTGLAAWVQEPANNYDEFLATSTGFNAYDFNAIDDPIPLLRDLDGLPPKLRDVRRISLRQAMTLESVEESSRKLLAIIDSHSHN
jgi:hypothetical protein